MNAINAAAGSLADPAIVDDPLESGLFTRLSADPQGRVVAEASLLIGGMTCAACADTVEAALLDVAGVVHASVSAAGRRALVQWDPAHARASDLIAAVRAAGYEALPDAAAPARELRRAEQRRALWRLFVAWFCMMQVMMLATPSYVAGPGELADDLLRLLNWGQWVLSVPVLAFSAAPFLAAAWRGLRRGGVVMEQPVALGVLVTFVASTGAAFDPGGPFGHEVFFDSMTMFVAFVLLARWLEMRLRHRSTERLERMLAAMPATALRLGDDGQPAAVSVQRLTPGDRVLVPLGEAFPADGRLIDGRTAVDEAMLTGEAMPVPRQAGEPVLAGSLNVGAPATMRVERLGADTRHQGIVRLMQQALTQRPDAVRTADRWAGPFLLAVIGLAALAALVWSQLDPDRALWIAVSVLIVTCPCALSLSVPAALVSATAGMARNGVHLQRLEAIEAMARADVLFVDKTGTLTEQGGQGASLRRLDHAGTTAGLTDALLWHQVGSLAQVSSHPVAQALAGAAGTAGEAPGPGGWAWEGIRELAGQGMQARDDSGRVWRLGAPGFAFDPASALGPDHAASFAAVLSCNATPVAAFELHERLRAGTHEGLQRLRAQGLDIRLLSGDQPARAWRLARLLGIERVTAKASPADKLVAVREAQARGATVMMVGDGLNDAPVLAQADVSLAMGHGALISRAHADAVVASGSWLDISQARTRAQATLRRIRENLGWAATYNALCVPAAVLGYLPPWAAGLGMALSSLLVVANSARLAR